MPKVFLHRTQATCTHTNLPKGVASLPSQSRCAAIHIFWPSHTKQSRRQLKACSKLYTRLLLACAASGISVYFYCWVFSSGYYLRFLQDVLVVFVGAWEVVGGILFIKTVMMLLAVISYDLWDLWDRSWCLENRECL